MLSEVLGVLIAFVSIMLLLSMVVTGLVQATQSLFRLRARNLLKGVATLVRKYGLVTPNASRMQVRAKAAEILNEDSIATIDKVARPQRLWRHGLLGPKISWVKPEDLAHAIRVATGAITPSTTTLLHDGAIVESIRREEAERALAEVDETPATDPLVDEIKRMEPAWSKRFQYFARLITVAWSLLIAVGFQISAPELISALTNDPERTARILGEQDQVFQFASLALAEDTYDLISDDALDALTERYPMFEHAIAQAGNAGSSKQELLQQLQDVLPDSPERPEIIQTYSALIDELVQRPERDHSETTRAALDMLAQFGIDWWPHDWDFYFDHRGLNVAAIFGVLMTGILLSFGAPFWFEQLRTLAALRDLRAPVPPGKRNGASEEKGENP